MAYEKWSDVFSLIAKEAKAIRAKNPKLSVIEASAEARKSKVVLDAHAQFNAHKAKREAAAAKKK